MKKILFILLLFCQVAHAQTGIVITCSPSLFNSQDSIYYSTVYSIPSYSYGGWNGIVSINIPLSRSAYAAEHNQVLNFVNIPVMDTTYISSTGYPTTTALYNVAKKFLNNNGFAVTTF